VKFPLSCLLVGFLSLSLVACNSSIDDSPAADADPNAPDADPNAPDADPNAPDGAPTGAWTPLITADWTMPAGTPDYYRCSRLTVTEDSYITSFRALAPQGTHHTVVTIGEATGPDGDFDCSAGTNDDAMLFASGVGTDQFTFPPGVAVKITAGQQLLLNVHLFNASDATLTNSSGTEVRLVPVSEVQNEAEMIFAGQVLLSIPPSGNPEKASGYCQMSADATILNVWPHMHTLGTHMKVDINGSNVIHDAAYDFNEQTNYPVTETVNQGDRVNVECTYINNTGSTVEFGDGTMDEMCFAGFYRYPAQYTGSIFCTPLGNF
jgi:hypothetical protein